MNALTQYGPHAARIIFGLMFFVFGLNGFLGFLPQPQVEGDALKFIGGLAAAPYFFPLLKGTEILVGFALLSNRFVPLALTVLAPITINIIAYNLFLAPGGMGMAATVGALHLFLMWHHRASYRQILTARTEPQTGNATELHPAHI